MNSIIKAIRNLPRKGQRNGIKILSLSVGLAMGLILLSKVVFEQTYDNFYPDLERLYLVRAAYKMDGKPVGYGVLTGGVAPGLKAEIPEVEAATRLAQLREQIVFDQKKNRYSGYFILADPSFFDVIPRPVLVGNIKDVLSQPLYAMVSESFAQKMNSNITEVVGETIFLDNYPGRVITIGGIFKDVPENTELKYDVILSLVSFEQIYQFDCTEGWEGCDHFTTFVKLYPGVHPENIRQSVREMQGRHMDLEGYQKAGIEYWYEFFALKDYHATDPETKKMSTLLGLLAFALIFTAVMNYILVVISTMISRTKEVAVIKCFGASGKNISSILFGETFVHLMLSLLFGFFLIVLCQDVVRDILRVSIWSLFTPHVGVIIFIICVLIFFSAGLLPSYLLGRIPVAAAFRTFKESRRIWKLTLLFIQFVAASFLVTLLIVIGKQYNDMINDDMGYSFENLLYCDLEGVSEIQRSKVKDLLYQLPCIENITSSEYMLLSAGGGNYITIPGIDNQISATDMGEIESNFLDILEIPLIAGRNFTPEEGNSAYFIISKKLEERLINQAGWTDGAIGKTVFVTGHEIHTVTILGVVEDVKLEGSWIAPAMFFPTSIPETNFYIKVNEINQENIEKITNVLETALPDKIVQINSYKASIVNLYEETRLFRNSVLIGGIVTLLISLIGLIGYINDEINRRKSEIAIRKINGATIPEVQKLFIFEILYIALPSLIIGGCIAFITAQKWQESFIIKTALPPLLFGICILAVLLVILSVVSSQTYKAAIDNPINSLKDE